MESTWILDPTACVLYIYNQRNSPHNFNIDLESKPKSKGCGNRFQLSLLKSGHEYETYSNTFPSTANILTDST